MNRQEFIKYILDYMREFGKKPNVLNCSHTTILNEELDLIILHIHVQYYNQYDHVTYKVALKDDNFSYIDLKDIEIFNDLIIEGRNKCLENL